jgi:uridine phosphorylase
MTDLPPLLGRRDHDEPSVLTALGLLREARREKKLLDEAVPPVCVLDPDGDFADYLVDRGQATRSPTWACYHTDLYEFDIHDRHVGVVPRAVGGPFAVLVAEQLFASGCQLLISVTSAGQVTSLGPTPYFTLITRALRDEGTSHHYLPASDTVDIDAELAAALHDLSVAHAPVHVGQSWTTDAPYRETETAIRRAADRGVVAVEMEAASLYAFARATGSPVVCFAHVTNQMASVDGDFDKGHDHGAAAMLALVRETVRRLDR